jgi:hypothetical protein
MRYLLPLLIAAMLLLTSCVQVVLEFDAPRPRDLHPVCSPGWMCGQDERPRPI